MNITLIHFGMFMYILASQGSPFCYYFQLLMLLMLAPTLWSCPWSFIDSTCTWSAGSRVCVYRSPRCNKI